MINQPSKDLRRVTSLCRAAAFTLTEMLTVVAVVSLLALLSISASARTNSYSERAVCLNNLKQLATASVMYAAEHADELPHPNWGQFTTGWAYKYDQSAPKAGLSAYRVREGLLWPYIKQENVFLCPGDKTNSPLFRARTANAYQDVTSYLMNGAVSGFSEGSAFKLSAFAPNAVMFWQTSEKSPFNFNDGSGFPEIETTRLHGEFAMLSLFDGSAEMMPIAEKLRETGPEGTRANLNIGIKPGRFWCNPATPRGTP